MRDRNGLILSSSQILVEVIGKLINYNSDYQFMLKTFIKEESTYSPLLATDVRICYISCSNCD